jgi:hypothetical protein
MLSCTVGVATSRPSKALCAESYLGTVTEISEIRRFADLPASGLPDGLTHWIVRVDVAAADNGEARIGAAD